VWSGVVWSGVVWSGVENKETVPRLPCGQQEPLVHNGNHQKDVPGDPCRCVSLAMDW
jgi:hypothetical protein